MVFKVHCWSQNTQNPVSYCTLLLGAIAKNLSCVFLCLLNKVLNWSASETFLSFLVFSFWFFGGPVLLIFVLFLLGSVFRIPTTTVPCNNVWKLISSSYFKIGKTEVVLDYFLLKGNWIVTLWLVIYIEKKEVARRFTCHELFLAVVFLKQVDLLGIQAKAQQWKKQGVLNISEDRTAWIEPKFACLSRDIKASYTVKPKSLY